MYQYPLQLTTPDLRPDIVTWPNNPKEVTLIELTVCFETTFEAATLSTKPPGTSNFLSHVCQETGLCLHIRAVRLHLDHFGYVHQQLHVIRVSYKIFILLAVVDN